MSSDKNGNDAANGSSYNGSETLETGSKPLVGTPFFKQSLLSEANNKDELRFRLSTFDQLISPLRVDNPFGKLKMID